MDSMGRQVGVEKEKDGVEVEICKWKRKRE